MTGLDTNVLVRYLTQDDPVQSAQANQLIKVNKMIHGKISSSFICGYSTTYLLIYRHRVMWVKTF